MSTKLSLKQLTRRTKVDGLTWQQAAERAKEWRNALHGNAFEPAVTPPSTRQQDRRLKSNPWWKIHMAIIHAKRTGVLDMTLEPFRRALLRETLKNHTAEPVAANLTAEPVAEPTTIPDAQEEV